jgi:hypothetical protein
MDTVNGVTYVKCGKCERMAVFDGEGDTVVIHKHRPTRMLPETASISRKGLRQMLCDGQNISLKPAPVKSGWGQ